MGVKGRWGRGETERGATKAQLQGGSGKGEGRERDKTPISTQSSRTPNTRKRERPGREEGGEDRGSRGRKERRTHLGDSNEADEARRRCCGEVGKEEGPNDADVVDRPHVAGALPLGLAFPAEGAREGEEAEGEGEVAQAADEGAGERERPRE